MHAYSIYIYIDRSLHYFWGTGSRRGRVHLTSYLGLATSRWVAAVLREAPTAGVGFTSTTRRRDSRAVRVESTRACSGVAGGGSKADGAVHDDRRDDEEESDLHEHRGTAAGRRHGDDSRLLADDSSEALRAGQLAVYVRCEDRKSVV